METLLLITFVAFIFLAALVMALFFANLLLAKCAAKDSVLFDNSWKSRLVRTLRDWTSYGTKLTYLLCYSVAVIFRFTLAFFIEDEIKYRHYA